MVTAFTYADKTLNDNWFEDRMSPVGKTAGGPKGLHTKTNRPYETDLAYIGERYDVLSRIARIDPRPSFAIPDDGFNEKMRTSSVDFCHPRSRKEFVAKPPEKPKFITTETVPEVCYEERRPIPGNARGFGAVLNRHEENHERRYWNTTSGDTFGEGLMHTNGARSLTRLDPYAATRSAGMNTEDEEGKVSGVKVGVLCGEEFRETGQPASDTRTQRAWLYTSDASLRNIHHGGTRPKLTRTDNELSVPIGEGAMKKVREDLKERQGRLFRTATQITKGRDKRPGVAIFQDDP
mmetsp:Transcript_118343/g.209152  ORF Transcript_118343/g.209152 Transcript_118343/m.209152 type:complete len:293 (+) Transcript_118343:92-970(+)